MSSSSNHSDKQSYLHQEGTPERVFLSNTSALRTLVSFVCLIMGGGILLLGILFVIAVLFPSPEFADRRASTKAVGYVCAALLLGLATLV